MRTERTAKEVAEISHCRSLPLAFGKRERPSEERPGKNVAVSGTKTITNVRRENSDDD